MICKNLDVWKRSCRISIDIYKYFARCNDYGFKDQITRNSLSIASNITEGMEKDSKQMNYFKIDQKSINSKTIYCSLFTICCNLNTEYYKLESNFV